MFSNELFVPSILVSGKVTPEENNGAQFKSLTEKYQVTNTHYPLDLFDPNGIYGGNYLVIYINSQASSKFISKDAASSPYADSELGISDAKGKGSQINQIMPNPNGDTTQTAVNVAEGVVGAGIVGAGVATAAKTVGLDLPIGTISSVVTGVVVATGVRETKRLKGAIALPISMENSTRYSVNWNDDSTLAFDVALNVGKDLGDAVNGITSAMTGGGGGKLNSALKNMSRDAIGIVQSAALNATSGGSAFAGKAANPKKEQIFNGVDFRPISLNYRFTPKSMEEYQNIREIIYQLEFHMHPEYSDSSYVFTYPSEFDIVYYNNGKVNPNLPKFTSCVLREMVVNRSPNGKFNSFEDGIPTEITLQLNFVELAILTKEDIYTENRETATY